MMAFKDRWQKWKEKEEEENRSLIIWETEEYIGRELNIEKDGNDSL